MAQKVVVSLVDDLDGGVAEETVQFGLDGKQYEIDLSEVHAKQLREVLADFIEAARRPGGSPRGKAAVQRASSDERERNQAIRDWARTQNMKVSDRGRIPTDVIEAYNNAN